MQSHDSLVQVNGAIRMRNLIDGVSDLFQRVGGGSRTKQVQCEPYRSSYCENSLLGR